MPRLTPDQVRPGKFITADGGVVEDGRRGIKTGAFLTSTPIVKRAPLPADLSEFQGASDLADQLKQFDRQHAASVAELTRRLQAVKDGLDAVKKAKRK